MDFFNDYSDPIVVNDDEMCCLSCLIQWHSLTWNLKTPLVKTKDPRQSGFDKIHAHRWDIRGCVCINIHLYWKTLICVHILAQM